MNFENFFRLISYTAVFCGFLALWVSGTFGAAAVGLFISVIATAWLLEGSRWQISEKIGTALIVLALPAFYLAWKYQLFANSGNDTDIAGVLARMILTLTAVKLLQRKSDRDWIFLYLMSFFEVLLAAGLSISALYMASFILYFLVMVCAVIAFEIRKTAVLVTQSLAGETLKKRDPISEIKAPLPVRRLPTTAVALIVLIAAVALPLFFMLPRVGGAGFGGNQNGLSTSAGFSDSVRLGGIGRIQQNDGVAMRVRFEKESDSRSDLYFRGVVLDTFDNMTWSKSKTAPPNIFVRGDGEIIMVDERAQPEGLSVQTIYLEPMDSAVLFALPRIVGVQGSFPVIYRDAYGSLKYRHGLEFSRVSYTAYSDRSTPPVEKLRSDNSQYTTEVQNFRTLPPSFDQRITELAARITANAPTRYDKAKAVESYLQTNFGYTLEQKASGPEPLADFLFNIREGHCEYFATAMAIMLRTQGVATRIVNGFHGGEYNDTANVTIVRQRNAHAWVEVFFPGEDVWVKFDPTPSAGLDGAGPSAGIMGAVNKYLEALETFWIQNFVAYDNQEQRSLARSVRTGIINYQESISEYLVQTRDMISIWLAELRGDKGFEARRNAILYGLTILGSTAFALVLIVLLYRLIRKLQIWERIRSRFVKTQEAAVLKFYQRMQRSLAQRGMVRKPHLTPMEFARASGISEVERITEFYNRVRFGNRDLSREELDELEVLLIKVEAAAGN